MHRFLRLPIMLVGLFMAVSCHAVSDPQPALTTEDDLGPQIQQPIEFPHYRHAGNRNTVDLTNSDPTKGGMEINCQYCHTYARRSLTAGIPPLQKCIFCHRNIPSVRDKPRIVELFKQPAFSPVPIELQVAILFAMQKNFFDAIDARKIVAAASAMKEFFATRKDALLTEIRTKAALDKDLEAKLQAACDEWKASFAA